VIRAGLPLLLLLACNKDGEFEYVQFNAKDDSLTIAVGAPEELPAVSSELHSSTGEVVVGTVEISPGGGPIGTTHDIVVIVDNENEDQVDRVTVRTDSPGRGEDEYKLTQDSADEGYYKMQLVSVGAEGEQRDDVLTIRLWQAKLVDTAGD
jgi:hypothetical protein